MKQTTTSVLALTSLLATALFAEEGELILKMDLTKTENGNPTKWENNQYVNKKDKVQLVKDTDESAYLQAPKGWIHYRYVDLFPVNETDSTIVTVKARGRGHIEPGFYIFDRKGGFRGATGKKFTLTPEWQEFRAEIPLVSETVKGKYPVAYPGRVRPLVQTLGKVDFKDYSISIIRNPILKDWVVNMSTSSGIVKAEKRFIILPGFMEYTGRGLRNVKIGDKAEFIFRIRGKGKLEAGIYSYDLKYNPARKTDKSCGETVKSETIDSTEWKEVKISMNVENIQKDGKTFYVNRIREFFRTTAQDGAALELEKVTFRLSSETIDVPNF